MDWKIGAAKKGLKGEITVPPDKSISHRAVMFSAISKGKCRVKNFLFGEDCLRTLEAFQAMGIEIEKEDESIIVEGKGLRGLKAPSGELYMGNSGTSMRIMSGILAGQNFDTFLTGDDSLSRRPMKRVIDPLLGMGVRIESSKGCPPLRIKGINKPLDPIRYVTPVASAQVKSCILSAGLYADGETVVTEPFRSRDHTEKMLAHFSADIIQKDEGLTTKITGLKELISRDICVPGDISSAAFFIVGALLIKGSDLILKNVGINPTRTGLLKVLERMGAKIELLNFDKKTFENSADMRICSSSLKGTIVEKEEIPSLIDEVPILLIASLMAEGRTKIRGIAELKAKESDRIKSMSDNLKAIGAVIFEENDALITEGRSGIFKAGTLNSFGDHRIVMTMAIASLLSDGESTIKNTECVDTSYPNFLRDLGRISV
ncbi:MAG: 3-phosphoshikimate 1-carboxyvinyltransferase [Candidatus Omnitrophota bacterium]